MITLTTLRHPLIMARVYIAMRNAIRLSRYTPMEIPVVIRNRKGGVFLMVWHCRLNHGAGKSGFAMIDASGYDVTNTVINSLKA